MRSASHFVDWSNRIASKEGGGTHRAVSRVLTHSSALEDPHWLQVMAAEMREALRIPKGSFVLANLNMLYKLDVKIVRRDEPEPFSAHSAGATARHCTAPFRPLRTRRNGAALAMAHGPGAGVGNGGADVASVQSTPSAALHHCTGGGLEADPCACAEHSPRHRESACCCPAECPARTGARGKGRG